MMICLTTFLTGCLGLNSTDAAFKDVQRKPPRVSEPTIRVIVRDDRDLAVWIEETARACDEYGCI